ncbi:MAG: hypothetical protein E8D45_08345 [Nitrospira sp.]|nr:MAG: hypothetical protein E8D45_08345 [Nitrospira sp.]
MLVGLIGAIFVLNALHTVDHVLRGDFHWPLDAQSIVFVAITVTINVVLGVGLWLSGKGRLGWRFWAVTGAIGLAFGWFSHFSPFTDQPPMRIYGAYQSATAGGLAVALLVLLMLTVLATTVYAGFRWSGARRA